MRRTLPLLILACACLLPSSAPADDAVSAVPAALKPWEPWVLRDLGYIRCPFMSTRAPKDAGQYICAWPGRLHIDATANGASFSQHWQVETRSFIELPSAEEQEAVDVRVNGQRMPMVRGGQHNGVSLQPGDYEITGKLPWSHRPQRMSVPEDTALVGLTVDGKPVLVPDLEDGVLTLGRSGAANQSEALDIQVFRKLSDGVPAMLETQIQVSVSGDAREVVLGPVLPADFVPVSLGGELAARFDADGKLRVQLQPGYWELAFKARSLKPLSKVTMPAAPAPWPAQEVWSYEATPRLRNTSAHGEQPIDPDQAQVPGDWPQFPAFAMRNGSVLTVEERSRGLANANRLQLDRTAWLDFDGDGMSVSDHLSGKMYTDWRLDAHAPYVLEHAESRDDHLMVTQGAPGDTGVEVRNPNLALAASLRLDSGSRDVAISGWSAVFDSVREELYLPYGYLLIDAPGADRAMGSWLDGWSLLDVFLVAVIVFLAWRLLGKAGGIMAALYLLLAFQEPGAPLRSLAAVLVLGLVLKNLPTGRLGQALSMVRNLALVVLLVVALPFLANQLRYALYPQLQPPQEWGQQRVAVAMASLQTAPAPEPEALSEVEPSPAPPPAAEKAVPESDQNSTSQLGKIEVTGTRISMGSLMSRYAPNTVIPAGRGEPDWRMGSSYELSWSGPVHGDDRVRLVIAPPWLTRLLRLVLVGLFAVILYRLARGVITRLPDIKLGPARIAQAMLALALFSGATAVPQPARAADYPPDTLLTQLRQQLTQAPDCSPRCAGISRADVRASGDTVLMQLEVHAAERVAVPVPAAKDLLSLQKASLDGKAQDGFYAGGNDGDLWMAVPRGVHVLLLEYRAAGAGKAVLAFPLRADYVSFDGDGWQAGGIEDHHLVSGNLELTRLRAVTASMGHDLGQQLPPFMLVKRTLQMDLDWRGYSRFNRVSPASGGYSVSIAPLPGEHVVGTRVKAVNGRIVATLQSGQDEDYWESRFDRSDTLTLTAPPMDDHAEVWDIAVNQTWHAEFSGLPNVQPERDDDFWIYEFYPLPGETLTIKVIRPVSVGGSTLAVDDAELRTEYGVRSSESSLLLDMRSTQPGEHVITLPAGAEVLDVRRGKEALNLRPQGGKLSLPLSPGDNHFDITWREDGGARLLTDTPAVDVDSSTANMSVGLALPADRWVIFTYGPRVGPAVLYWGELLAMVLVAFGLSRLGRTPLRFHHWLLLGLGFSTFSWKALLVVVAWLLALDARRRQAPEKREYFNLMQGGLVALTAAAVLALVSSIPYGLLGQPDMHITGNGSSAGDLLWFADLSGGPLPVAHAVSIPMWCYKLAMLAWALWLAAALVNWLRWGFAAWSQGGYWRTGPRKRKQPPASEDKKG